MARNNSRKPRTAVAKTKPSKCTGRGADTTLSMLFSPGRKWGLAEMSQGSSMLTVWRLSRKSPARVRVLPKRTEASRRMKFSPMNYFFRSTIRQPSIRRMAISPSRDFRL